MKILTTILSALLFLVAACDSDQDGGGDTTASSDTQTPGDIGGDGDVDAGVGDANDSGEAADTGAEGDTAPRPEAPEQLGGDRPSTYTLPSAYDPAKRWPLVVSLHGYTASGFIQSLYFGLGAQVDSRGFILITPDGLKDLQGKRYWNATDACCDFAGVGVDDVGYITGLVDEAAIYWNIDPDRVYLLGHSNGGFMSYRLSCDAPERFAAMASLAGATFKSDDDCQASRAISVLQIHGTADQTIRYEGGSFGTGASYPSAEATTAYWAGINGCTALGDPGPPFDIDTVLPGDETTPRAWTGCDDGVDTALWTMQGGGHIPNIANGAFIEATLDWLFDHRRPAAQ